MTPDLEYKYFKLGSLLSGMYNNKRGWIKVFGKGIKWKHESEGLIFSERNGYRKYWKVGNWIFGTLIR